MLQVEQNIKAFVYVLHRWRKLLVYKAISNYNTMTVLDHNI